MILYHGSYIAIEKPDLSFSRLKTDFGRGFYLTPLKEQAISWSQRFLRERGAAVVSAYESIIGLDADMPPNLITLKFDAYCMEWLDFITACRLGQAVDSKWDLVIGGVANDKVFDTLQLYFDKLISAQEAIGRLRYDKPNLQYCFKTRTAIETCLQFMDSEVLS
jgi:hypothetical protein